MEGLLSRVASQSISFAIRSGIGVVSGFAMQKGATYIRTLKGKDKEELRRLHERLESKIKIITPAIDLIELIAARGNTALESAVSLTKSLRLDIQNMGIKFANAMELRRKPTHEDSLEVERLIRDMLRRLDDVVPLINLALNTSGVDLSTALPEGVSPSRLLQASMLIVKGDAGYVGGGCKQAQIGFTFNLTMYMLFQGHAHRNEHISASDLTWQEVISKCRVKLERVPLTKYLYGDQLGEPSEVEAMRSHNRAEEYCYELVIIEDLDDGRVHDEEELERKGMGGPYEGIKKAGLRARIPVHQIGKMFYTNSGKLLGIDEATSPVLLINRHTKSLPPRRLEARIDRAFDYDEYDSNEEEEEDLLGEPVPGTPIFPEHYDFPRHLDQDWLAFEIYQEPIAEDASDLEDEDDEGGTLGLYDDPLDPITSSFSPNSSPRNSLIKPNTIDAASISLPTQPKQTPQPQVPDFANINVTSHLSLLEVMIRLLGLQMHAQKQHLSVHDELLNLFLSNQSSAIVEPTPVSQDREREMRREKLGFEPVSSFAAVQANNQGPGTPTRTRFPLPPTGKSGSAPIGTPAEADLGLPLLEGTPAPRRSLNPPSRSSSCRPSSPPVQNQRQQSRSRDGGNEDNRLADRMNRGLTLEEKRRSGHGYSRDGYANLSGGRMTPISRDSASSTSTISNRGNRGESNSRNSSGYKEPSPDEQLRSEASGRGGR